VSGDGIKVGPVYQDPRGKVSRDGEQEHCFTVWEGSIIVHKRANSRARAEELRERFLAENDLEVAA